MTKTSDLMVFEQIDHNTGDSIEYFEVNGNGRLKELYGREYVDLEVGDVARFTGQTDIRRIA